MYIILATAYLFCAQNIPEVALITIMSSEATGASALSKSFMNLVLFLFRNNFLFGAVRTRITISFLFQYELFCHRIVLWHIYYNFACGFVRLDLKLGFGMPKERRFSYPSDWAYDTKGM